MTDQITLEEALQWWWEEACKRPPSSFYEKLDYVAAKAAEFGWQQRDASVADELQEARDEELEECCEWIANNSLHHAESDLLNDLRAARRPQPKSLAEEALEALKIEDDAWPVKSSEKAKRFAVIRRALERLQELERQSDG